MMIIGTLVLLGLLALLNWPRSEFEVTERRITRIDEINGIAWVPMSATRTIRVRLPRHHDCGVGDRIKLAERRTLWGVATEVAMVPRPCSRP
jgi:hypothetical protein